MSCGVCLSMPYNLLCFIPCGSISLPNICFQTPSFGNSTSVASLFASGQTYYLFVPWQRHLKFTSDASEVFPRDFLVHDGIDSNFVSEKLKHASSGNECFVAKPVASGATGRTVARKIVVKWFWLYSDAFETALRLIPSIMVARTVICIYKIEIHFFRK